MKRNKTVPGWREWWDEATQLWQPVICNDQGCQFKIGHEDHGGLSVYHSWMRPAWDQGMCSLCFELKKDVLWGWTYMLKCNYGRAPEPFRCQCKHHEEEVWVA